MWFRMKRMRSELKVKKLGLMWAKFVTASAGESTTALPWMPLWLGIHTKVTERRMEDKMARRVCMRVTGGWNECTLEMGRESAMMRKY